MPRRLIPGLALCALATLPAALHGLPEPARLVVRAMDWNGQPVAGATVELAVQPKEENAPDARVWTAETTFGGRARLSGLPTGEPLWLLVARPGLVPVARSMILRPGERRRLRVDLGPGGLSSGRVIDEQRQPVADAEVRLESQEFGRSPSSLPAFVRARAFPTARTDKAGRFQLRDLPKGDLWVEVLHPSVLSDPEGLPIQRQRDLGDLVVRRGVTLTGWAVDTSGRPVPDLDVWLLQEGYYGPIDTMEPDTRTGRDGSFSIPNLQPYGYTLHLCSRETLDEIIDVHVLDEPLKVTVHPAATVQGRVLAPDGRPAAGAEVRLMLEEPESLDLPTFPCPKSNWDRWTPDDSSSTTFMARAVTDSAGRFSAGPLQGGWFSAEVLTPGLKGALDHLRVEPGEVLAGIVIETETAALQDDKGKWYGRDTPKPEPALALLRGRVVGPRGRPVEGALLDSGHGQTWTDAAGSFEIRIAADEEACFDISKPGFASIQSCALPKDSPVEIPLPEGITLFGRVLNLNPEDPKPVIVYLSSESFGNDFWHPIRARADGTFRAGNLPPETIQVRIWAGEEQGLVTDLELAPGDTEVWADFELPPVVSVSGRVLDDLGAPVAHASVYSVDKYHHYISTDSRADGSFVLYLSPAKYEIYAAAHENFHLGKQEIEVADAPVEGLDFLLKRDAEVEEID